MNFSEFVNVLFHYKPKRMAKAEFVRNITDAYFSEKENDKGVKQQNPVYDYKDRMLQYIFNGEKHISQDVAQVLAGGVDREQFEGYFDEYSYDALENICSELGKYGFDAAPDNVAKVCSSILDQIICHIAAGESEDVTKIDYVKRESGRRIKDVPLATVELRGDKLYIGGETITLDPLLLDEKETDTSLRYIQAFYEACESALHCKVDESTIHTLSPRYQAIYKDTNDAFFLADAIDHRVRETFDDGAEEFEKLKQDEWNGISVTYWNTYANGFDRLLAVLNQAVCVNLTDSCLIQIRNLINTLARKGICHILVNDGVIESWVFD